MRRGQRAIVGAALLIASIAAHAVPVSFQFVAAPGSFSRSGPGEEFPPPPVPAALNAWASQPIVGSFTFETVSPSTPGYLPYEGQLVEVGASYANPVMNFDLQLGDQLLSFSSAAPAVGANSSITVVDLPPQLNSFPGDFYRLAVTMGTGLVSGFESYRVSASISMTSSDLTRIQGYDPLQPLQVADAPWNLSFSLFDPTSEISYDLFTPVTQLERVAATEVPEPGTSTLFALGVLFCLGKARRRLASS